MVDKDKTFVERRAIHRELPAYTRWQGIYLFTSTNNMKRSLQFFTVAAALVLAGASCGLTTTVQRSHSTVNSAVKTKTSSVTYSGQDGKNALELLQSGHRVDVSSAGFVNAIDGVAPADHQFWALYVNGKQAEVGAKDYQTKTSDQIEWKLEAY